MRIRRFAEYNERIFIDIVLIQRALGLPFVCFARKAFGFLCHGGHLFYALFCNMHPENERYSQDTASLKGNIMAGEEYRGMRRANGCS